jgi:hypothetical protein
MRRLSLSVVSLKKQCQAWEVAQHIGRRFYWLAYKGE